MTSPDRKIRTALLGYGFAGKTFHAPLIAAVPQLDLCLVGSGRAEAVHADLPGISVVETAAAATAPDIDLVIIATPNDSHYPLACAAIAAGKHVVVDKPFTLDLPQARDLAQRAAKADRLLSVFHNRRWDSDFLSVRNALDGGMIGDIVHFESHFDRFRPAVRDRWRESAMPGGGIWFDLGPHLVDQALLLMGLPDAVQASFAQQRDGALIADWAHVILHFGERRAILHASMLVAGGPPRFIVHGTRGSVVKPLADIQESQLLQGITPAMPGWGQDKDPILAYDGDGRATAHAAIPGDQSTYYRHVAAAIALQHRNPVPPIEAIAVMAVIEAATQAASSGKATALPLTDQERHDWRLSRSQ